MWYEGHVGCHTTAVSTFDIWSHVGFGCVLLYRLSDRLFLQSIRVALALAPCHGAHASWQATLGRMSLPSGVDPIWTQFTYALKACGVTLWAMFPLHITCPCVLCSLRVVSGCQQLNGGFFL